MNEKETSRLEAFSDGVFAVAITLLVLNISLPVLDSHNILLGDRDFWRALGDRWPTFVAYIISFLTIGVMWLNHHRLFVHIKRIDTVLLFINLLLLLIIVFIPFPTSLLANYIISPSSDHAAAVFYSGTCLLMACCFNVLWNYASYHNRLLGKNVDEAAVKAINRQYIFGPLLYLIIFGVAWLNTILCVALVFILALFFALPSHAVNSLVTKGIIVNADTEEEEPEELEL